MSFSDVILALLVLGGLAFVMWILDINPYSKQLQVYNQTCTEMILDDTYCKGEWVNDPVVTYIVDRESNFVSRSVNNQSDVVQHDNCTIVDRKNWSCALTNEKLQVTKGIITHKNADHGDKRQITRLQWLQNKLLALLNK